MVEVSLTVGKLDASIALLLTKEHHLIEFPTVLLPNDVEAGSIVKISCERDFGLEKKDQQVFEQIQDNILESFGTHTPKTPQLKVKNVTQTSVVLEWDPIDTATSEIISLTLYKNGARFGVIPTPLKRTATKLSGLSIDTSYSFYLVLATTGGTFKSEEITVKTHKMTDLSGITICVGNLEGTEIDRADLEETVKKIGAKPLQDSVKLDTTHFICTVGEGPHWQRAQDLNIPIVRPEWIKACEAERRLVGVRAYYLNADPKLRPPVNRPRASSYATQVSTEIPGHASPGGTVVQNTATSAISVANVGNAGDESVKENNAPSAINLSKHQRTVSEIQDSPLPTPTTPAHPTEPVIEESEENEQEKPAEDNSMVEVELNDEKPKPSEDKMEDVQLNDEKLKSIEDKLEEVKLDDDKPKADDEKLEEVQLDDKPAKSAEPENTTNITEESIASSITETSTPHIAVTEPVEEKQEDKKEEATTSSPSEELAPKEQLEEVDLKETAVEEPKLEPTPVEEEQEQEEAKPEPTEDDTDDVETTEGEEAKSDDSKPVSGSNTPKTNSSSKSKNKGKGKGRGRGRK